jgi:hypothetical protein
MVMGEVLYEFTDFGFGLKSVMGERGNEKGAEGPPLVVLCVVEISWRIRFSGWWEVGHSPSPVVIGLHCFRFRRLL